MKKTLCIIVALAVVCSALGLCALGDDSALVYVTVSDGRLQLANCKVEVSDSDGDHALTVNDALFAAHEKYFPGKAAAGYSFEQTDYGLSLTRLWGIENGGSYGYYVNNALAWNLSDPVKDGDFVNAYVYADTVTFSDVYCFFDRNFSNISSHSNDSFILYGIFFDQNFNSYSAPIKNADILVNGKTTDIKTDQEGKFSLTSLSLDRSGTYTVSAKSDSQTLVPPALTVTFNDGDGELSSTSQSESVPASKPDDSSSKENSVYSSDASADTHDIPENPKTGQRDALAFCAAALLLCGGALLVMKKK